MCDDRPYVDCDVMKIHYDVVKNFSTLSGTDGHLIRPIILKFNCHAVFVNSRHISNYIMCASV